MTPTDTKAVKAELEPRLISPSSICTIVVRIKALTGTASFSLTTENIAAPGIASSRANAHVHLEAATVIEIEQNIVTPKTKKVSPRPPPGEPITTLKIYGRACPLGAARISSSGGRVAQIGMMKKSPAVPPTGTQRDIARGTLMAGSATSSAMEEIMPMAEKV